MSKVNFKDVEPVTAVPWTGQGTETETARQRFQQPMLANTACFMYDYSK